MIEMTCRGCGREGRVPDSYAGLRVTCKKCRAATKAPDPVTREVDVARWIAAIDAASEAGTVEFDTRMMAAVKV